MQHFLLIYDLVDDYLERRTQYRDEHLRLAWEQVDAGMLMLGGALEDPVDQAMLLFHDASVAQAFARADPYVTNGLVKSWRIRRWTTVVGGDPSHPCHPE